MAATNDVDLLIIGGGCAGLSLARMLARYDSAVRTLVVEPRSEYTDDRSWCFWHVDRHRFRHLVSSRWDTWRFSTSTGTVVQTGNRDLRYQCLRSIDFYDDARELIGAAPRVELETKVTATSVTPSGNGFKIETSAGTIRARYVVDTRPVSPDSVDRDGLWQVFTGAEVRTDHDVFEPGTVGLMDDMSTDKFGFRFTYTLPFSRRHALVEETRFTHRNITAAELQLGLQRTLASLPAATETLRTESGRLPMAVDRLRHDMPAGFVAAGIGGGAVRAS
ncbi:MAG: lycopene cyclase family protein, partial [Woeseiaceae bacterium]